VSRALSRIEKAGIPTFTITRKGFGNVVRNAFMSQGLAPDAALHEWPAAMFLPGSDLAPLRDGVQHVIDGLTRWTSRAIVRPSDTTARLVIEAADYPNALDRMHRLFLQKSWGDSFPLMPPTQQRVDWILRGSPLSRHQALGRIMPSGNTATVESAAIALALAGGRPEYLPFLIACLEAFTDPRFRHQMMQATTCSVNVAAVVNGPAGHQARINSGYGCLGPDPRHPGGSVIGRALRLIQQDVGHATPGCGTMAIFGGPLKFANAVFAEDDADLPDEWASLAVERGIAPGANAVTLHAVATASNITVIHASNKETVLETLHHCARIMGSDYGNIFLNYYENSAPGVLILPRGIVRGMVAAGWTKQTVKRFLWEHSQFPLSVVSADAEHWRRTREIMAAHVPDGDPWPITVRPENLMIAVAGGAHSGHGYWMRMGCCPTQPITVPIRLPSEWDCLLAEAESDLGTMPTSS
jgi:hypothetical protein